MALEFLVTGPEDARATVLLAHGAGAPMDSAGMNGIADALTEQHLRIARFEFAYMASRRAAGGRKPPPRAERVMPEFVAAVRDLNCTGPLIIGGKSMGGRVATMVADACYASNTISGVLCLAYPFHPPKKPTQLRTAHLKDLNAPALIVQGTRDPFGTIEDVPEYELSPNIELVWMQDGDHDLKPRKRVTGLTLSDHMKTMASHVSGWIDRVT